MKLAVIADIHANREAMRTVLAYLDQRGPDQVVVAGDIINRGPEPRDCLAEILERRDSRGWRVIKGNHEDFVLSERHPPPHRAPWLNQVFQHSTWTCREVEPFLDDLAALPDQVELDGPSGETIRFVHASMESNRDGLFETMSEENLRHLIHPAPHLMCVGHTHRPFIRRVEDHLIVNAGAVGLPFDRDPRASLAWVEWVDDHWDAEIVRLPYDRAVTRRAMDDSGYLAEGGPMVPLVVHELEHARPNFRQWHVDYEQRVAAGELTVAEAVADLLRRRNQEERIPQV